ncbi:biotin carboxylase N-terminal domain-containing protein [Litoribacillus peritrichatus]
MDTKDIAGSATPQDEALKTGLTTFPFLTDQQVEQRVSEIQAKSHQDYGRDVLQPVDDLHRSSAVALVHQIADQLIIDCDQGPLFLARCEFSYTDGDAQETMELAVVAQNRSVRNGVWMPSHHRQVEAWLSDISAMRLPVVTFIDTPGANAGADANEQLQAHSISSLICRFCALDVPTVGVIYGKGYSGGAIPLAATNRLLAVRDGVFSTIQPQGLAAIARREKLSWQQCARLIGISAVELQQDGTIDGVIDFSPLDGHGHPGDEQHHRFKLALGRAFSLLKEQVQEGENIRALRAETLRDRLTFSDGLETQAHSINRALESAMGFHSAKHKFLLKEERDMDLSPDYGLQQWLKSSHPVRYEKRIQRLWLMMQAELQHQRCEAADEDEPALMNGRIGQLPTHNPFALYESLALELALYLYHQWQSDLAGYVASLKTYWLTPGNHRPDIFGSSSTSGDPLKTQYDIKDLVMMPELRDLLQHHLEQLVLMDCCYEVVLDDICAVAWEYSLHQVLSVDAVNRLLKQAVDRAVGLGVDRERSQRFLHWLNYLQEQKVVLPEITRINEWKQRQHPRTEQSLLVVAGYFVSTLLVRLYQLQIRGIPFDGAFQPTVIGRQKNFWHRVSQASRNIRVQQVLNETKKQRLVTSEQWTALLFSHWQSFDQQLTSSNGKQFPGFSGRIEQAVAEAISPCGLITGVGTLSERILPALNTEAEPERDAVQTAEPVRVAAFISNVAFQAGAFDMAAAEKLCRLLKRAEQHNLPVIGLVSSGGMQTKEGGSALFSMAVVNEAISQFVDAGGQLLMIGFGDCTGGAQASLMTHPDVDNYYLSGTNLPFAGQVVVPEHLPLQVSLSNYLKPASGLSGSTKLQAMSGLIRHPFIPGLDTRLRAVDPGLPMATESLKEVLADWLMQRRESSVDSDQGDVQEKIYRPIEQVLIHSRGCTAERLIQAVHKAGKTAVLVQSDPDMHSRITEALHPGDRLVCLGGQTAEESYLNAGSVLRVAELEGVDALHPGIGFLSENADFAAQCLTRGINFIGPDHNSIALMGDKAQAIATARAAEVPVVPGSHGVVSGIHQAKAIVDEIGLPVLIKASHGGGGKGIGIVTEMQQLEETFLRVGQEANSAFGSADLYIERLVEQVRHIEVQVLRDRYGHFRMAGIRDCSLQRNRQKIIEESGEYVLTDDQIDLLAQWSERLSEQIHYVGAGTVEFLYDLSRDCFYFMEMNTRLQVEHLVTEMTSGLDLVEQQLRIAEGLSIDHLPAWVAHTGHAIEVRINAETVSLDRNSGDLNVLPATGVFERVVIPEEPWAKVLTLAKEGCEVTPFYDSLVAQVVVHGDSRAQAIERMTQFLKGLTLDGVNTNQALLQALLADGGFEQGNVNTLYVDQWAKRSRQDLAPQHSKHATPAFVEPDGQELLLRIPSTGVIYFSPSPDSRPFVQQGDVITPNQTLLLLEVMKMFMPIKLEHFFKNHRMEAEYEVVHCRNLDGQYVQEGETVLTLKAV